MNYLYSMLGALGQRMGISEEDTLRCATQMKAEEINKIDKHIGTSHFHTAVCGCSAAFVKELIDSGADIELATTRADYNLATPLHIAGALCRTDVIRVLLNAGARVDPRDDLRETPLFNVIEACPPFPQQVELACVELLLNAGADIEATNKTRCTPLNAAIINKKKYMVEYLLQRGADINVADGAPLYNAVATGDNEILFLILSHPDVRADLSEQDGCTPLTLAQQTLNRQATLLLFVALRKTSAKDHIQLPDDLREQLLQELVVLEQKLELARQLYKTKLGTMARMLCASCAVCKTATSKSCARFRAIFYCSQACQNADWRMHRKVCVHLHK